MNPSDGGYQTLIDRLRERFGFDFVSLAFAQTAAGSFVLTWRFVSGNLNTRYRRIVLQSGKGIAGIVFKTGKPMLVTNVAKQIRQEELYQYPIIVSEQLQSLGAIPLYRQDRVEGVLLAGYREADRLTEEDFRQLQENLTGPFGAFEIKEMTLQ